MNENAPRNIALTFYETMMYAVSTVLLIVLLGCFIILYIAYKPVFRLTTKLQHTKGEEFETIGKILDDRSAKIEVQEMLILDLLLNNLLYRVPISKAKLKQLGITETVRSYTVFLLNGYVLPDAETRIPDIKDILAYIEEHYCDVNLSQTQLADQFHISVYTLSRIFRNDIETGFATYINTKRVEYAKELLLTTGESVHNIAMRSGFDNDNKFLKYLKQIQVCLLLNSENHDLIGMGFLLLGI